MAPENENLNEEFELVFDDADVITVPIDTTLSNPGEAADAKAVGDALALKADASSVIAITVNGEGPDLQGAILVDGTDIPMSSSDPTTVKAAVEAAAGRTGADIPLTSAVGAPTISEAIDEAVDKTATDIPMAVGSSTTISQKIAAMDVVADTNSSAITTLQQRTGETIMLKNGETQSIADAVDERVKSVNGTLPDATGNVQVEHTLTADNLTSNEGQTNIGTFTRRTSGGAASIATGSAWLSIIRGDRTHVGYVPESLTCTPVNTPREQGETQITTEIDRDTFVAYVSVSGTTTLTYTTSWSADPTLYGVTVTGTPKSGDQIVIVYVKEDRGTIYQSAPYSFISTGWNLYDDVAGYAVALKYADQAYFRVAGTYTSLEYSATVDGAHSPITVDNGLFEIMSNGYVWVNGAGADTEIYMTWGDWTLPGEQPAYAAYTESVIDLEDLFTEEDCPFPYGLLRVADIRDEINFNTGTAISRVDRMAYSAENLAEAQATGRAYEYDTNYIYLERAEAISTPVEDLDGSYDVNDHGLEMFTNTSVAVYTVAFYGANLKNKLERDVLTKSQDLIDNLTTNDGTKALSAKQGKLLNDKLNEINDYYSLGSNSGTDTPTTTKTNITLWAGRKFSTYKMIAAIVEDNNVRASMIIPQPLFQNSNLPLLLSWVDSVNTERWVEVGYVSDTSYSLVGSSNLRNDTKLRLLGLK